LPCPARRGARAAERARADSPARETHAPLPACAQGKVGPTSLETYTYTADVPTAQPDQVYTYGTSVLGDNTYTYTTSVAGDNTYSYTTAVAPTQQTFTYNTNAAVAPESFAYSTTVAPQDNTYTYVAGPQAAAQDAYTYTANPAGGPALYTYNANAGGDTLSTYNAQEVNPQMTTINGYVQDNKPEQWWNVPIGEIHPLDTAGRWDLGAVHAINPDSTARASAPLTLTGERADGTVASEDSTRPAPEDRLRAARTTQLLEMPQLLQTRMHATKFNALAVARHAHLSQARLKQIYKTPVNKVYIDLFVYVCICLCVCLSIHLSVCLSVYVCLYLSVCLCVYAGYRTILYR
jgi:hypothetical protein